MRASNKKRLKKILDRFHETAKLYDLTINVKKTNATKISKNKGGYQVNKFKYLGAWNTTHV